MVVGAMLESSSPAVGRGLGCRPQAGTLRRRVGATSRGSPLTPTKQSSTTPPGRKVSTMHRLDVIGTDMHDVIHSAGGWLFDRARMRWDVRRLVGGQCVTRAL